MVKKSALAAAEPSIAEVAALIGDPGRAAMLCALIDGFELSAGNLAHHAGLAANAASAHLAKLVPADMLRMRAVGRARLYRLAGKGVADALEALSVIARPPQIVALSQSNISNDLRCARSCYDHLAGRLGVAVTERLVAKRILVAQRDLTYRVTPKEGHAFWTQLGVDLNDLALARRHFARQCMDWSERRPHLAGALGAALRDRLLCQGWVKRKVGSRALRITDEGRAGLRSLLALNV